MNRMSLVHEITDVISALADTAGQAAEGDEDVAAGWLRSIADQLVELVDELDNEDVVVPNGDNDNTHRGPDGAPAP